MESQHNTKRYKLQQKIRPVEKYLNKEASQYEIAREFKVDQKTISRWIQNKEKLIALMQSDNGKKELRTRKNLPKREKGSTSEMNKKQKRLHKAPTRYGFEDSEDEQSVDIQQRSRMTVFQYPFQNNASVKQNTIGCFHSTGR